MVDRDEPRLQGNLASDEEVANRCPHQLGLLQRRGALWRIGDGDFEGSAGGRLDEAERPRNDLAVPRRELCTGWMCRHNEQRQNGESDQPAERPRRARQC